MKINHLNLTVNDVTVAKDFLQTYFGLQPMSGDTNNEAFALLFDDDGFVLTLMKAGGEKEATYPATFHIGFMQENREQVDFINMRLKEDGFDVKPPRHFHGSWTFYLKAPGGFLVEVLH